jgi:ethanolamine permease
VSFPEYQAEPAFEVLAENCIIPEKMGYRRVSQYHLLALGLMGELITTASWNLANKGGLGFQLICNVFAAAAYVIFFCCTSELSSALPFPGGNFAFARCTAGFYAGFLVGCIEIFYYVLALGMANAAITEYIVIASPSTAGYEFVLIFVLYVSQFVLCLSKRFLYNAMLLLTIFGVVINFVFIIGAVKHIDFNHWAYSPARTDDDSPILASVIVDDDQYTAPETTGPQTLFSSQGMKILGAIGPCLWTYQGLEYVNLMSDDVDEPRRQIPFAQLAGIGVMIFFNTVIPILASSMRPGTHRLSLIAAPTVPGMVKE